MKPIKNIAQLKAEQKRLQQERRNLEQQLREEWDELKSAVKPVSAVQSLLAGSAASQPGKNNLLKETLAVGISFFAKKLANKAGDGISHLLAKRKARHHAAES